MPNDLDELDAALRRAMAALEGEAPPGYFEALPARTLARLDDPAIGDLPDEPGRRGIRDLAGEHRARPRRAGQGEPPPADDEVFASQIMAAVELPEPDEAPEPAEPPEPAKRVASAPGPGFGVRSASSVIAVLPAPPGEPVEPAMDATGSRPASAAASMPSAELPERRRSRRVRAAIVGIGGIGLAAAVAVIYLGSHAGVGSAPPTAASGERAVAASGPAAPPGDAATAPAIAAGGPAALPGDAASAPAIAVGTGSGAAPAAGSSVAPDLVPDLASGGPPKPVGKLAGSVTKRPGNAKAPSKSGGGKLQVEDPAGTAGTGAAAAGSGTAAGAERPGADAQQSPDKPGPSVKKIKSNKPRPDRTQLSSDDIERAMTAVAGKARACAAGTSGTASLRLTVAPSGRIAQVTVTGPFAGTPVGACVERAVRTATFPPWDGAPQSFNHSYLLSD